MRVLWYAAFSLACIQCAKGAKCLFHLGLPHGNVKYLNTKIANNIGGQVQFSCSTGWKLNGTGTLTCQSIGKWDGPAPTCISNRCPHIVGLEHGFIRRYSSLAGERVFFQCLPEYMMVGQKVITCDRNKLQWTSSPPKCIRAACPEVIFFPGGNTEKPFSNTIGSEVTFVCDPGYLLVGAATITCLHNQRWSSPIPKCECDPSDEDKCVADKKKCPQVLSIPDGTVKQTSTIWVQVTCRKRFRAVGIRHVKCVGGKWGKFPVCKRHHCLSFENVENGIIKNMNIKNTDGAAVNSVLKVECDKGFRRQGPKYLKCLSRTLDWSRKTSCTEHKCPDILSFPNGSTLNLSYSNVPGKAFRWLCDDGFELRRKNDLSKKLRRSDQLNICRTRGLRWTNSDVVCVPKT